MERHFRVNLLGPGPRLIKKKNIYLAAVSQRLRNNDIGFFWRPMSRWDYDIKMVLQEILGMLGLCLSDAGLGHVAVCCENGNERSVLIRCR